MVMFPQLLVVTRQKTTGTGTQGPDGVWVPAVGPNVDVLYSGKADVQDILQKDMRETDGGPTRIANGIIFLHIESAIENIKTDDKCEITYVTGRVEQAVVVDVRRLDGALLVQRLREA